MKLQRVLGASGAATLAELEDKGVVVLKDTVLDLEEVISKTNAATLPLGPTFSVHWLSVQGTQPTTAENPAAQPAPQKKRRTAAAASAPVAVEAPAAPTADLAAVTSSNDAIAAVKQVLHHHVSQELQWYFEKVVKAVHGGPYEHLISVCDCVATDQGLQQLVPYFAQFILNEVSL